MSLNNFQDPASDYTADAIVGRYDQIEAPFTPEEIRLARLAIGEDALAGIGYASDYKIALRSVSIALASIRIGA